MIPTLLEHRQELQAICRRFHVARLDIFGSAAEHDTDREAADLDFLVEFERSEFMSLADQYFGLLRALQELFDRDVDLLTPRSLRNPHFIQEVERTKRRVYAA